MISWLADKTRRFHQRPFFSLGELDRHCERIVRLHNAKLFGQPVPGLSTDGLLRMLNHYADLHPCVDVSKYGVGIEAVTCFETGKKPTVRVGKNCTLTDLRTIT